MVTFPLSLFGMASTSPSGLKAGAPKTSSKGPTNVLTSRLDAMFQTISVDHQARLLVFSPPKTISLPSGLNEVAKPVLVPAVAISRPVATSQTSYPSSVVVAWHKPLGVG